MDLILITLGAILIVVGFIGAFLPVVPDTPLSYAGLLLLQFTDPTPFSLTFMIVWAVIVIGLMIVEYFIPVWGTKKFGGTSWGVWGSIFGLLIGLFFPPFGIIIGPLIGAFSGELIGGKEKGQAFRAAWGSFLGLLLGTLLNVIAAGLMGYYFFAAVV